MRLPLALIAGTFALSAIAADPAACDRRGLLALLHGAAQLDAEPTVVSAPDRWFARVVLHDAPLVMDGYKYDGVIDVAGRQMWMVQYGGIAGHVQWFGPVAAGPELFAECPEVLQSVAARAEAQGRRNATVRTQSY